MKNWKEALVFLLFAVFLVNYIFSGFTLSYKTSFKEMSVEENYYLGNGLHWRGLIKPKLVNVRLRNKDGSLINQNHHQVEITPLIDLRMGTGAIGEETFQKLASQGKIEYVPLKEAVLEKNNSALLVLRVKIHDEQYENTVKAMVVDYRILGIPKRQSISYNGFLINN